MAAKKKDLDIFRSATKIKIFSRFLVAGGRRFVDRYEKCDLTPVQSRLHVCSLYTIPWAVPVEGRMPLNRPVDVFINVCPLQHESSGVCANHGDGWCTTMLRLLLYDLRLDPESF